MNETLGTRSDRKYSANAVLLKSMMTHLGALLFFLVLTYMYMSPVLSGQRLIHGDKLQSLANQEELVNHYRNTGEIGRWSTRIFAGMPADMIFEKYPANLPRNIVRFLSRGLKSEVLQLYLLFASAYVCFICLGYPWWMALPGAVLFGLSTEQLIAINAGHATKIRAVAFALPILTGTTLLFKRLHVAFLLILVGTSFLVSTNHLQIVYYTFIISLIIVGFESWNERTKSLQSLTRPLLIAWLAVVLALLPNVSLLWSSYEYSQDSVRGRQILETKTDAPTDGLDYDYAGLYSHGILETGTLIVPGLFGGSSQQDIGGRAQVLDVMQDEQMTGFPMRSGKIEVPMYWGGQPGRGGPFYLGIWVLIFAIIGLLTADRRLSKLIVAIVIIALFIAWGKNTGFVHRALFDLFPYFNKFRTPSMILLLMSFFMIWLALEGFRNLNLAITPGRWKGVWISVASVCVLSLFIGAFAPIASTFTNDYGKSQLGAGTDTRYEQDLVNRGNSEAAAARFMVALRSDRKSMVKRDAYRSLLIALLIGSLTFAFYKNWLPQKIWVLIMAFIGCFDVWLVGERYFNNSDFHEAAIYNTPVVMHPSDSLILSMSGPGDRMVDLTTSVFQDASPSYYHRTIGGNHGAKLRRYQDVIDRYLLPELSKIRRGANRISTPGINMLNTKFIKTGRDTNSYLHNITAWGPAWIIDSVHWVETHDGELESIAQLPAKSTAVIHEEFRNSLKDLQYDKSRTTEYLEITAFNPDKITYRSVFPTERLVVFSEIWYRGNEYWKSSIDGVPASHIRANYLLRAMRIPAGSHEITFEYRPRPYHTGEVLSLLGSIVFILALLVSIVGRYVPIEEVLGSKE